MPSRSRGQERFVTSRMVANVLPLPLNVGSCDDIGGGPFCPPSSFEVEITYQPSRKEEKILIFWRFGEHATSFFLSTGWSELLKSPLNIVLVLFYTFWQCREQGLHVINSGKCAAMCFLSYTSNKSNYLQEKRKYVLYI